MQFGDKEHCARLAQHAPEPIVTGAWFTVEIDDPTSQNGARLEIARFDILSIEKWIVAKLGDTPDEAKPQAIHVCRERALDVACHAIDVCTVYFVEQTEEPYTVHTSHIPIARCQFGNCTILAHAWSSVYLLGIAV